ALGAPTRLRQRLSATSPFLAQYSELQIAPSPACAAAAAEVCACPVKADTSPAPTPRLAPLRMARRASAWSGGNELSVMASSDSRRERAADRILGPGHGSACDLIRSPKTAKAAGGWAEPQSQSRTNLSQRKPSRACARFASRCRPSARNARSGPSRRGIGHRRLQRRYGVCGKFPGYRVTGRPMEPRPQDRERKVLDALHRAAVFCDRR